MAGLEKITAQIMEDARGQAEQIKKDARETVQKIMEDAKKECENMKVEASKKEAVERSLYKSRIYSSAQQQRRMTILRAKQETILKALDEAYYRLKTQETDDYFNMLEKWICKYALAENGEIYFSEEDLARMPEDFEARICCAAEEKGGRLKKMNIPGSIEDGFLLVYGGIEENCTIRAIMNEKKDQLQDEVNRILFS